MMDDAQLSRSMSAYVETFSEPDEETTSRMRERVTAYAVAEQARRRTRRRWLVAGVAGALALGGLGVYALGSDSPATSASVLEGGAGGQHIDIPGVGSVELAPGATLHLRGDLEREGTMEIVGGEVRLVSPPDAAATLRVRSAEYELSISDAELVVRHTGSLPVVRVERGRVRLSGPDLPASGLWLSASEKK